ncbi:MAG: HYExAFE family protein, partial [Gemmataceae bacterium]
RFPSGPPERPRRVWECWSTQDDIDGLQSWLRLFGPGYLGLLVFTYCLGPAVELPDGTIDLFTFRGRRYLFRGIEVMEYREHMRTRSPKWATVDLASAVFRQLVQPLHHYLGASSSASREHPF